MTDQGTFRFVQSQLNLVREQHEAVVRGDITAANAAGDKIKPSLPALSRLIRQIRSDSQTDSNQKVAIEQMIDEIRALQNETADMADMERDRLSRALQEIRRGRQLLRKYRPVKSGSPKLIDGCV